MKSTHPTLAELLKGPIQPWPDLDDLPPIPEKARERILDRLEAAWADGTLQVDDDTYEAILCALLEEDFRLEAAGEPDQNPPGSSARIQAYYRRAALGGRIFIAADRKAVKSDAREGKADREAVLARDRGNHTGVVPLGWTDPDDELPPVAAGIYHALDGVCFELN